MKKINKNIYFPIILILLAGICLLIGYFSQIHPLPKDMPDIAGNWQDDDGGIYHFAFTKKNWQLKVTEPDSDSYILNYESEDSFSSDTKERFFNFSSSSRKMDYILIYNSDGFIFFTGMSSYNMKANLEGTELKTLTKVT